MYDFRFASFSLAWATEGGGTSLPRTGTSNFKGHLELWLSDLTQVVPTRNPIALENLMTLDPKQFDDLAQRLAGSLPKGLHLLHEDLTKNLRASLEAGLAKLDLVTRAEFDVQAAVLARTRAKLAALEARIAELERDEKATEADQQPPV